MKKVAKELLKVFRLSEDYDSDSDASDDENKVYRKGYKRVVKNLEKSSKLTFTSDGKKVSLA